jgi:RecA-family ATPase
VLSRGQDHDDTERWADQGVVQDTAPTLLGSMVSGRWLDEQVFPPLNWAVPGVVPEGFGLLVAPPKAGKSWMVAGLGLACAAGGYALGKIAVGRRPVLYLALEDGHRRLQSRFRTLMEGAAIPDGIDVVVKATAHDVPGVIAEWLDRHPGRAPLVILDTLGKVKPPKSAGEDSYAADYRIGTRLKELIDAVPGATLLVVHHTRKAESPDFVDAVSGTQGIAGSADFVLVLSRSATPPPPCSPSPAGTFPSPSTRSPRTTVCGPSTAPTSLPLQGPSSSARKPRA